MNTKLYIQKPSSSQNQIPERSTPKNSTFLSISFPFSTQYILVVSFPHILCIQTIVDVFHIRGAKNANQPLLSM